MKVSWLVLFFALLFELQPVCARDAQEILNRSTRLEEERVAWNPKPITMEEFLNPRIPLKDKYPTIDVEPRVGGMAFWMDNRYAMVWAGGPKDAATGIATPYLAILDTDSGEIFNYKPGRLMCYRDNRLTFETGPNDEAQRKRWNGPLGSEVEIPIFASVTSSQGKKFKYWVSEFDCENKPPDYELNKAAALFGVFRPKDRLRDVPKRTYDPLLPEHGFFSTEVKQVPDHEYDKTTWFKANGEKVQLDLNPPYEISSVEARHWAPFLGRYVFQGSVMHSLAPHASHTTATYDGYMNFGNFTATFSPLDGTVVKIHRPRILFDTVQTTAVFATRAGFLWVAGWGQPRGYYLSRGEEVKRIFDYEVDKVNTWISPDGCKIMSYYNPKAVAPGPSRMAGPLGALLDFSSSKEGRKNMAIINLCKGE